MSCPVVLWRTMRIGNFADKVYYVESSDNPRMAKVGQVTGTQAHTENELFTFQQLFAALRRRWWVVLLTAAVLGAAAYGVALLQSPRYEAKADVVYEPPNLQLYGVGLPVEAGSEAHNVQSDALTLETLAFAERVQSVLGSSLSSRELLEATKVEATSELEVISVIARSSDPGLAADIANGFAEQFVLLRQEQTAQTVKKAMELVKQRLDQLTPEEAASSYGLALRQQYDDLGVLLALGVGDYQILQSAMIPAEPVLPRPALYVELAVILGLLLGCGLALLVTYYDRRFKDAAEVREALGAAVLGLVPKVSPRWVKLRRRRGSPVGMGQGREAAFNSVRTLRSTLKIAGLGKGFKSLLVTSALPGEGKSTVAVDLALALALSGQRVLLVDADLRSPSVAEYLGLPDVFGLAEVLTGQIGWTKAIQTVDIKEFVSPDYLSTRSREKNRGNGVLLCMTSGKLPPNPAELLEAEDVPRLLGEMRSAYDVMILDTPPLLVAADAVVIGRAVDAALLVTRLKHGARERVRAGKAMLEMVEARLVGVVVVGGKIEDRDSGYYYQRY